MIGRRSFFGRLIGGAVAALASRKIPAAAGAPPVIVPEIPLAPPPVRPFLGPIIASGAFRPQRWPLLERHAPAEFRLGPPLPRQNSFHRWGCLRQPHKAAAIMRAGGKYSSIPCSCGAYVSRPIP